MIDLKLLKKIATGGQAEIFEINENMVLRLLYREEDNILAEYEFKSLQIAKQNGIYVPAVFEIVNVDNRPGIIMEKTNGITMTKMIQANPFKLFKKAKELGELHYNLNKIDAPEGFINLKQMAMKFVEKSTFIDSEIKNFVYMILGQLPDGVKLCHGDFHPGNIIIRDSNSYIIDWCGATSSDPIADVADTYLILKNMPRLPDISFFSYQIMKLAGLLVAKTYFNSYNRHYKIDTNLFSKWLVVRAAERTYYGMSSEKVALVKFIYKCYNEYSNRKDNYKWYKFL